MNDKQKTKRKHDVRDLCRRARTMAKAGKYREAEKEYALALETDRTNVYALVGLGDVKRKTRQFEEAVSYYQKALEVEKENTFA
ncbi:MAG: tetratricopeptide repeat protein, partial [Pseudomonadota bacterium]